VNIAKEWIRILLIEDYVSFRQALAKGTDSQKISGRLQAAVLAVRHDCVESR